MVYEVMKDIERKLKYIRTRMNLSMEELGEFIGTSHQSVQNIEAHLKPKSNGLTITKSNVIGIMALLDNDDIISMESKINILTNLKMDSNVPLFYNPMEGYGFVKQWCRAIQYEKDPIVDNKILVPTFELLKNRNALLMLIDFYKNSNNELVVPAEMFNDIKDYTLKILLNNNVRVRKLKDKVENIDDVINIIMTKTDTVIISLYSNPLKDSLVMNKFGFIEKPTAIEVNTKKVSINNFAIDTW